MILANLRKQQKAGQKGKVEWQRHKAPNCVPIWSIPCKSSISMITSRRNQQHKMDQMCGVIAFPTYQWKMACQKNGNSISHWHAVGTIKVNGKLMKVEVKDLDTNFETKNRFQVKEQGALLLQTLGITTWKCWPLLTTECCSTISRIWRTTCLRCFPPSPPSTGIHRWALLWMWSLSDWSFWRMKGPVQLCPIEPRKRCSNSANGNNFTMTAMMSQ